ncbi:MAG: type II toxin-antitoxin system RelE/ParE family toxin [Candidatus Hydrogenedentes bacterium]|nr:type II toxin-antitoxin system RelE/ParE family toxin [Candidatus Hydrogenedentota bacterium]
MPIQNFRNRSLRKLFEDGDDRKIPPDMREKLIELLDHLDAAASKKDLDIAGFHELKGDRKGCFAWKVTANYRLTFKFKDGDATDVDLEDYH